MKRSIVSGCVLLSLFTGILLGFRYFPVSEEVNLVNQINKSLPKTVMIKVYYNILGKKVAITGSGVFVTKTGYILTARHLFTFGEDAVIELPILIELYSGEIVAAEVAFISPKSDLALLKTWTLNNCKYAKLENPVNLKVGQVVYAIGNPLNLGFSVSSGIISQLFRDINLNYNVTQSDTAINPGNSGGPLFNSKGKLVGINSFMASVVPFFPVFSGLGFSVQCGQCYEFLVYCSKKDSNLRGVSWL